MDLFDEGLLRMERRLDALIPAPVRPIPILIGGSGPKRTLPAVARHATIWHSFLPIELFRTANARVGELAAGFGRADDAIKRSVTWRDERGADALLAEGASSFITEINPTADGFDFATLEKMFEWRASRGDWNTVYRERELHVWFYQHCYKTTTDPARAPFVTPWENSSDYDRRDREADARQPDVGVQRAR